MKIYLLLFMLLSTLIANNNLNFFQQKAKDKHLYTKSYWHKLLHYEDKISTIKNKDFFVAKDGNKNPESEMMQTIKVFLQNPSFTCRYPARYKWLRKKLNFSISPQKCIELQNFLKPNFKHLTLVFTSEKYNSAGSMFGHTFLKVGTDTIPYAINYSAKVPKNTNPIEYAYQGIFGGFVSGYKLLSYFIKNYEYQNEEFRDLLEFKLKFTYDEINNMMLSLYELKDKEQDYYFLSRNCSSEIMKLLDMANENSNLSQELQYITIPINVVYILNKHHLLQDKIQKFSKLKRFYRYINLLSTKERQIVYDIANHNYSSKALDTNMSLSQQQKSIIIEATIIYLEIKSTIKKIDNKDIYLLVNMTNLKSKFKMQNPPKESIKFSNIPISNKFHKLSIGSSYLQNKEVQYKIAYRYLFRDRYDLMDDIKKHGSIELFDVSLRYFKDKVSLDYMTLFNLEAMPYSDIYFLDNANKIKLGIKRLFDKDELFGYFDYALGYRYKVTDEFTLNIFAMLEIQAQKNILASLSPEVSLEYNLNNKFVAKVKYEFIPYTNGQKANNLQLDIHLKTNYNNKINLSFRHEENRKYVNNLNLIYSIFF